MQTSPALCRVPWCRGCMVGWALDWVSCTPTERPLVLALVFWASWYSLEYLCFGRRLVALPGFGHFAHLGPFLLWLPETFATRAGWLCSGKFHGVCFSLVIRLWEETHWLEFPAKRLGLDSLGVTLGRWHCPRALGCSGRAVRLPPCLPLTAGQVSGALPV